MQLSIRDVIALLLFSGTEEYKAAAFAG